MDRLKIALELISEAIEEKEKLKNWESERLKLRRQYPDEPYYEIENTLLYKFNTVPHKSVVNDNLKMARRILLGEYM